MWNRLTANFWLPGKVPLSGDLPAWQQKLTAGERTLTMRVFTGLTMLDTVQATVGEIVQIQDARTEHEEAVYTNIAFMQAVHARSYSSVFSTLSNTAEIDDAYRWAVGNDVLQERCKKVLAHYYGDDPLKRKVASTLLSSLLLYAGFYLPLHFSTHALLTNTADMTRLILRDKAVHGHYSGYKYQRGLEKLPPAGQEAMRTSTYELLEELYELELRYSGELYEPLGLMDDVAVFVRYNANKALMNLGYPARFTAEETEVNPEILAALSPGACVLLKHGEVFLKGRNRHLFVERLHDNLRTALRGIEGSTWIKTAQNVTVLGGEVPREALVERARRVIGFNSVEPAVRVPSDLDTIVAAAVDGLSGPEYDGATFVVRARRRNKQFPLTSSRVEAQVGARLLAAIPGLRVDLTRPDVRLSVEIDHKETYVSWERLPGLSGLPVGSSGRALVLLSGGYDSPVAAHRAMRRGLACDFVHFNGAPYTNPASVYKAYALARELNRYQPPGELHVISLGKARKQLAVAGPDGSRSSPSGGSWCVRPPPSPPASAARRWSPGTAWGRWPARPWPTWSRGRGRHAARAAPAARPGEAGDHRRGAVHRHRRRVGPPRRGLLRPAGPAPGHHPRRTAAPARSRTAPGPRRGDRGAARFGSGDAAPHGRGGTGGARLTGRGSRP